MSVVNSTVLPRTSMLPEKDRTEAKGEEEERNLLPVNREPFIAKLVS
jgi:hypothetical protein